MANLREESKWETGIYQLETTDPVQGGADGIDNRQAQQLANRTAFLKEQQEEMKQAQDNHSSNEENPHKVTAGQVGSYSKEETNSLVESTGGIVASALVDESKCRSLLDVLGIRDARSDAPATVEEVKSAMSKLHDKMEKGDFSGLRIGDYLDIASLTVDDVNYVWNAEYNNLRIIIAGFNIYKHAGDTENAKDHIVFQFRNNVLEKRMNTTNTNAGGYAKSELCGWLESKFKAGLVAVLGDYMYTIRRLLSTKGGWGWHSDTVFLPTEAEVFGTTIWSEKTWGAGFQAQWPIYRDNSIYKCKKLNGSRKGWWEASPSDENTSCFCICGYAGYAHHGYSADWAGGIAPAFCVA